MRAWAAVAALIWGLVAPDAYGEKPDIHHSWVVREATNSHQNPLIFRLSDGKSEPGLVMTWLVWELVIDTPKDDQHFPASFRIPFIFANGRIVIARESAVVDDLIGKHGLPPIVGDRSVFVIVAHFIMDGAGALHNCNYCRAGFCYDRKGWEMACIFDGKHDWNSIHTLVEYDPTSWRNVGSVDPGSLLGTHFPQLMGRIAASDDDGGNSSGGGGHNTDNASALPATVASLLGTVIAFLAIKLIFYATDRGGKSVYAGVIVGFPIFLLGFCLLLFCFLPDPPPIFGLEVIPWHFVQIASAP